MTLQEKVQQIIEQPKRAVFWVALLSILPFFHWFALLIALTVTLRKGWREGLSLVLIIVVLDGVLSRFVMHYPGSQMLLQAINPLFLWLLAWTLRETVSWQLVLQLLTLVGIVSLVLLYHFYPETAATWNQQLVVALQQMVKEHPTLISGVNANDWGQLTQSFGQFATGLRIMLFLGMGFVSLIVARYVQANLYNPGGLKQELYRWHLNLISGAVILVLFWFAWFERTPVWLSVIPVLMLSPLCTGLSLLHYFTARYKYQSAILIIFYACVVTILPQLLFLVMLFGWLDCFINFRQRFVGR